jgi:hypothetical protein
MFVNRLLKTLHANLEVLEGRKTKTKTPKGALLFPSDNTRDPNLPPHLNLLGPDRGPVHVAAFLSGLLTRVPAQFFDFGKISNEEIMEESLAPADGYAAGLINLPAPVSWMEHDWDDGFGVGHRCGYLFVQDAAPGSDILGLEIRLLKREEILSSEFREAAKVEDRAQFQQFAEQGCLREYYVWDGNILRLLKGSTSTSMSVCVEHQTYKTKERPTGNNVFEPLMTMLGRLNADGVDREYCPSSDKPKRVSASHAPKIDGFTTVRVRPYRAPLGHSGPSTSHAPKRYHFRRGHVRHFRNGQKTWVRPCFVGDLSRGEIKHHGYEVQD